MRKFEGQNSISSSDFFGGGPNTSSKPRAGYDDGPDMSEIRDSVRQGVSKVAGRLSNLANGVMSSLQVGLGMCTICIMYTKFCWQTWLMFGLKCFNPSMAKFIVKNIYYISATCVLYGSLEVNVSVSLGKITEARYYHLTISVGLSNFCFYEKWLTHFKV